MECNKEEAIRAKKIAEKKMESLDFEGAHKIAQKARTLYPELENISQLLSICNVHCLAQKRILGVEKDWYGILQVEKLADELTVRKQYRRLALHLHPDKNRFPGAEAAFKWIVEAHAVLSDPAKKSVYDSRIRAAVRPSCPVNLPPHHMNVNRSYQFNMPNGFGGLSQHQAAQPSHSMSQEMFLTCCPFCSLRYQHPRTLLCTMLTCHHCLRKFVGHEISGHGVFMGPSPFPPVTTQAGVNFGQGNSVSREASQWQAKRKLTRQKAGQQAFTAEYGQAESAAKMGDKKEKHVGDCAAGDSPKQKESVNGVPGNREKVNKKKNNNNRKRGRKQMVCSSESLDSSSDSDLEDVTNKRNLDLNSGLNHGHPFRRSSRVRQNVCYTYTTGDDEDEDDDDENDDEDDFEDDIDDEAHRSPLKRSRGNEVSEDTEEHNGSSNQNGTVFPEESEQAKGVGDGKGMGNGFSVNGVDALKIETEDPEFYDFDKLRDEHLFLVNQIWACYDSEDSMPRFLAKIKKVSHSPFELTFRWLEAVDDACKKWINADLPVGWGTFKRGKTSVTDTNHMFSHQLICEKGEKRGSFRVYPIPGQIWALFREWDLNWSSNPDDRKVYKYEIVEVLSHFNLDSGLEVCYLDKVAGFVSLFKRSNQGGAISFLIRPNEFYKLSHCIPSYKMTGSEREGVPVGSYELDTAALPLNPDDLYCPGEANPT